MIDLPSYFGVGLRPHQYQDWLERQLPPYLEALADNYMFQQGGPGKRRLKYFADRTNLILHSVGLNIAGYQDLDEIYLKELKHLVDLTEPAFVSDHLCFTKSAVASSFDLLPFPRTRETLSWVSDRVQRVQEFIDLPLTLENVSSYVEFADDEMSECTFLSELCKRTGCGILLDVNNIIVSAFNHKFTPSDELSALNSDQIHYFHIAGHTVRGEYLHDTHDQAVTLPTWELLAQCLSSYGEKPIILERDDDLPLDSLLAERSLGLGYLKDRFQSFGEIHE